MKIKALKSAKTYKAPHFNTRFTLPANAGNARLRLSRPTIDTEAGARKHYWGALVMAVGMATSSQLQWIESKTPSVENVAPTLPITSGTPVAKHEPKPTSATTIELETETTHPSFAQSWNQVFDHLKNTWRVPDTLALEILASVDRAQKKFEVSPALILAVMATESSFKHVGNPDGNFNPHKPFGLMQVYGKWHPEKFPEGRPRVTRPKENIMIGVQVLKEYLDREEGNLIRALHRYNGSLDDPTRKYSKKVLGYYNEFKSMMQTSNSRSALASNP